MSIGMTWQVEMPTKRYKTGDLIFCNIIAEAHKDWKIAMLGGDIIKLHKDNLSWPYLLGVVLDSRPTLKVAKVYITRLGISIRADFENIVLAKEGRLNEHIKKHNSKRIG